MISFACNVCPRFSAAIGLWLVDKLLFVFIKLMMFNSRVCDFRPISKQFFDLLVHSFPEKCLCDLIESRKLQGGN